MNQRYLSRRRFLTALPLALGWSARAPWLLANSPPADRPIPAHSIPGLRLTSAAEIQPIVAAHQPLKGAGIPAELNQILGATHYDGRYHHTQEPYLIEGANALHRFGFGVAKFWFNVRGLGGYRFNSDWNLPAGASLTDLAKHPYFVNAFGLPFKTISLEVTPIGPRGSRLWEETDAAFAETEKQTYELACYLLGTYRQRAVTFILQNWEGDWMMRDRQSTGYSSAAAPDHLRRFAAMRRWLGVRQNAVVRARKTCGDTKARVLHALEVNRVMDTFEGIPTLTSHVLPYVDLDLISWSCYDGLQHVTDTWWGIEMIRHSARAREDGSKPQVFIGEVGNPENSGGKTESSIRQWWDERLGVFFAQKIPWIVHWQLYCNEPKNRTRQAPLKTEDMRGFWLLRPDGSVSWSGRFLTELLQRAGGRLK
jgi:hypothetical protein